MKHRVMAAVMILAIMFCGCSGGGSNSSGTTMESLAQKITDGETAENASGRVLIIDTRASESYLTGHIKDALNIPYALIAQNEKALYTNSVDTLGTDVSGRIADSWLAHFLVNQTVNDFSSTYADSTLIFYGENGAKCAELAQAIGYPDVSYLSKPYSQWASAYPTLTAVHAPGIVSVNQAKKSFVFSGSVNSKNHANVCASGTHHGIVYKGGGLNAYSLLLADIPPFLFQETLTWLGASPEGNMADGIYYGTPEEYGRKHADGQGVIYEVTWNGSGRYYNLSELFIEQPGTYDPNPEGFIPLGIEPRIGGTRDSNLNWNPGCLFCLYSCVCGITSNARANDNTWFEDGGIYDPMNDPDNPKNYYAGRYHPRTDILPAAGTAIQIRVTIVGTYVDTVSMASLHTDVAAGSTTNGAADRILLLDTRQPADYLNGHIPGALNVPVNLFVRDGDPLYTNGWDEISTTASDATADSWLRHLLVNQLTNDFISTYADARLVFYGHGAYMAARAAKAAGYSHVTRLDGTYEGWASQYPGQVDIYAPGVISVDRATGTIEFTGSINTQNHANVSTRATHHGITYAGGGLANNSLILADTPPFLFQELLTMLGASPDGNMADGIYYGDMTEWQGKYPDGGRVDFFITWDGASRYYELSELFEEKASAFDPNPDDFSPLGIEPRIGGTRDANLLWNPGCIFCFYSCVCGITSNARANEETWFADGGIYDTLNHPNDDRNYYAGRFHPKTSLLPAPGQPIRIKAVIID